MDPKELASTKALEMVKSGMRLGLGSGSTAKIFVQLLIKKCRAGLKIEALPSSLEISALAKAGGIPLIDQATVTSLDLTIDGTDEVDQQKRLIKGAGGALVREKILASMSEMMVVIADSSKLVPKLGKRPLPVEVIPFAAQATRTHLERLGYPCVLRIQKNGSPFVTDNQNWIFDIQFPTPRNDPEKDHMLISRVPGVVDTGFFFHLADRVIIGYQDGKVTVL